MVVDWRMGDALANFVSLFPAAIPGMYTETHLMVRVAPRSSLPPAMSTPDRQELLNNAIAFLTDPKAQASPLTQRIQFLEAKGLTPPEIDLALKQATLRNANTSAPSGYPVPYGANPYMTPAQRWDWRDYFITGIISGAVTYGAVALFKKYLLPHLQPPTATAYEEDRDALNAQFDAAEALLKEIQNETAAVRAAVEEQKEKIDKTTEDVKAVVAELREGEAKTRDEMREVREEVNNIREMLPKMIDKNKESQNQSISELQQEVKSLKALLLSRGPTLPSSSPASPLPMLGRPAIPAWQLATPPQPSASETVSPARRSGSPLVTSVTAAKKPAQAPKKPAGVGLGIKNEQADNTPAATSEEPQTKVESADTADDEIQATESTKAEESVDDSSQESIEELEVNDENLDKNLANEGDDDSKASEVKTAIEPVEATEDPLQAKSTLDVPEPSENEASTVDTKPSEEAGKASQAKDPEPPKETVPVPSEESPKVSENLIQPSEANQIPDVEPSLNEIEPETQAEMPRDKEAAEPLLANHTTVLTEDTKSPEREEPAHAAEIQQQSEPSPSTTSSPTAPVVDRSAEVESLQARLKQVEQRFSDVSTSFKRLQAEKQAADAILRESTPLESIKDANALREYFAQLKTKDEVFQEEIKRLNQKLELQEDRLEEIRDTHRLESHSLSEEVRKLRTQLGETEALFDAAQRATSSAEEALAKQKEEYAQLQKEVEAAKNVAKEEEEKRVKAVSLLKTVRQKLVKAEKDKEDALKEVATIKEREKDEKSKEQADRLNHQQEVESLNAAHEKATAALKAQFNKDMASMKERYESEIAALKGQFELDMATAKASHAKELGAKTSQITTLENSLNAVTRDKNSFFDQLQLRQAELESAQSHLESLQHQNSEIQFQLREANDRLALLKEEYAELMREQETRSREPVVSADEIARMVSATEAKYEAKLAETKRSIAVLEKERYEAEADWSRKLKEKVKELEDLKRMLGSANRTREAEENVVNNLKAELAQAQESVKNLERQVAELPSLREQIEELQRSAKEQESESSVKILVLEKQIEETRAREMQLKQSNKTLRDELRKVQSSAALLERQRNPGVGYWSSNRVVEASSPAEPRASISSVDSPSRSSSPAPGSSSSKNEEEVNLEYLRNVILQFLEHKEMRPNLVKVMSVILHFTPQETRRLIAKV
ncbi:hypothetical protein CVT26_002133 [Gymnopilus dilepis]|uniref:Peroxisomal membrane protein PEX14 n=1 Tax=Gymnopilus dilepis TaxID=231916 RepID=A0A409VBQ3_9AGAR|nr:hypothetical protein CVT26_002133 [Gymnopilus dilepis]